MVAVAPFVWIFFVFSVTFNFESNFVCIMQLVSLLVFVLIVIYHPAGMVLGILLFFFWELGRFFTQENLFSDVEIKGYLFEHLMFKHLEVLDADLFFSFFSFWRLSTWQQIIHLCINQEPNTKTEQNNKIQEKPLSSDVRLSTQLVEVGGWRIVTKSCSCHSVPTGSVSWHLHRSR